MAVVEQTFENLALSINDKLLYCSNSIGLDISVGELDAACARTGAFANKKAGAVDITASVDGLMTAATGADATTNVTSENLMDMTLARTVFDIDFGSTVEGEAKYSAKAFITSFSLSAEVNGIGTYSASLRVNGPLVKTINPSEGA
jgi:hypothetical protein